MPDPTGTNWPLLIGVIIAVLIGIAVLFGSCSRGPNPGTVEVDFSPILQAIQGVSDKIDQLGRRPRRPRPPGRRDQDLASELTKKQQSINWLYKVKARQERTIKKLQADLRAAQNYGTEFDREKYRIDAAHKARAEYLRVFLSTPFKPGDGERVLCFSDDGEPCYVRDSNGTKKTILPYK